MEKFWDAHNFYAILGLSSDSSPEDIRRAYRTLAMKWHPDRWAKSPSKSGEAKRKFQQIQEAYSVLSDPRKRKMYDAGLYDPVDEEDEGFVDFVDEMMSLIDKTRREDKIYSMEELQSMFWDMARSFQFSECSSSFEYPDSSFEMHQLSSSAQQQTCWFSSPHQQPLECGSSQKSCKQSGLGDRKKSLKRARSDSNHFSSKCSHVELEDINWRCTSQI